jgi:hypothetical protein
MNNNSVINIGDSVRKTHVFDGTERAGKPIGKLLKVVELIDSNPPMSTTEQNAICVLSDDSREYFWNLIKY